MKRGMKMERRVLIVSAICVCHPIKPRSARPAMLGLGCRAYSRSPATNFLNHCRLPSSSPTNSSPTELVSAVQVPSKPLRFFPSVREHLVNRIRHLAQDLPKLR